jgi:hypothetical protein
VADPAGFGLTFDGRTLLARRVFRGLPLARVGHVVDLWDYVDDVRPEHRHQDQPDQYQQSDDPDPLPGELRPPATQ